MRWRRRVRRRRTRGWGLRLPIWEQCQKSPNPQAISTRTFDGREILLLDEKLAHIASEHRDLMEKLGIKSLDQLRALIVEALQDPDEAHEDVNGNIFYLLRCDDRTVCVIVRGGEVQTAYLLGSRSYRKMARRHGYVGFAKRVGP